MTTKKLLDLILYHAKEFEEKQPLKHVICSKVYTVKDQPISSITCDDNGAYIKHNNVKRDYAVEFNQHDKKVTSAQTAHKGPHGYYYKERDGRMYVNVLVPDGNIVCVERYYSASKSFHWLKRMIVRVKYANKSTYEPYVCVVYTSTKSDSSDSDTEMLEHGNSKRPVEMRTPYIRTSPAVLHKQDVLLGSGKTDGEIYSELIKTSAGHLIQQVYRMNRVTSNKYKTVEKLKGLPKLQQKIRKMS